MVIRFTAASLKLTTVNKESLESVLQNHGQTVTDRLLFLASVWIYHFTPEGKGISNSSENT